MARSKGSRRFDVRVAIQSPPDADDADGQDEFGRVTGDWTTVETPWANVEAEGGGEVLEAGQAVAVQRFRVTMRRRADVTAKQRLRVASGFYLGQLLYVIAAPASSSGRGDNDEMTLICEGRPA